MDTSKKRPSERIADLEAELAVEREAHSKTGERVHENHGRAEQAERERNEARKFGEAAAEKYNDLLADQRILRCAFCNEAYPAGTPATQHESLTAHVKVCEKHPMRKAERGREELRDAIRRALSGHEHCPGCARDHGHMQDYALECNCWKWEFRKVFGSDAAALATKED